VVRVRVDEQIEVFDGKGRAAEAVVVEVRRDGVDVEVGDLLPSRESRLEVTLAAALIAPDKYELVLQKGCELGVARFVPVMTARVETRPERILGKLERWERILLEATKQCGRATLPVLEAPRDFDQLIDSETGIVVFDADCEAEPWPSPPLRRVTLVVGPEGGLTQEEVDRARRSGAAVCSLGPRRLRAETASITAITLAGSLFGDLMPR